MKKYYFLIIVALILGLVLTGCSLLSNIGQAPATDQSGITYLTKAIDPDPGLVGLWHFDDNADDISVNNNQGTVYGATYVTGKFGKALSFVGLNDYVEVGDASELRFGGGDSITIEAWVQPAASTALGVIVQKGGITDHNTNYVLRQAGKKVDFFYRGVDNAWHGVRTNADVLSLLAWNCVAVTYTFGTPASIIIYVNGIPCAVNWQWPGSVDPMENDQTLRFGGLNYWAQKYYGLIDEVRIWGTALMASQLNDMTPPAITITTPANGATYLLNQVVDADWSVTDVSGTGVAFESETVPIDTSTVGEKTFEVTAEDYAKNTATETVNYVVYGFGGILPPFKPEGISVFKLGRTIPVKFQLWDADGNPITDATARISLEEIIGEFPSGSPEEGESTSAATSGNLFRYDDTDNQYIFNLATKGLSIGTWEITITVNDSGSYSVRIGLK